MKEETALWKEGLAYLPTMFIPVFPVLPLVVLYSEFNSRLGFSTGENFQLSAGRRI